MVSKEQLTLAILHGGKGSRLGGVDKGQLRCEGRTLLERLLDLSVLCAHTLVVRDDVVPGKGAPGGVVTALLQAPTPHVLLVCCDMPRVTVESLRPLLQATPPAFFGDEPFPGVYPVALAPAWRSRLEQNPSMRALLASIERSRVALGDPDVVRSVNTREDAQSLGVDIP